MDHPVYSTCFVSFWISLRAKAILTFVVERFLILSLNKLVRSRESYDNIPIENTAWPQNFRGIGVSFSAQHKHELSQRVVRHFEAELSTGPRPSHASEVRRKLLNGRRQRTFSFYDKALYQIVSYKCVNHSLKRNHQNRIE